MTGPRRWAGQGWAVKLTELGLLVKRGPVPVAFANHIDELIGQEELRRA